MAAVFVEGAQFAAVLLAVTGQDAICCVLTLMTLFVDVRIVRVTPSGAPPSLQQPSCDATAARALPDEHSARRA